MMIARRISSLFLCMLLVFVTSCYPSALVGKDTYKVERVVDGDTIIINYNGKEEKLRMIGIDTPESKHADSSKNVKEGIIASEYTKSRIDQQKVLLEFDVQERDQYQRLLAYVYFNGKMINEELIEKGYAKAATFPPNVKYSKLFVEKERQARRENKGFWQSYYSLDQPDLNQVYVDKNGRGLIKGNINNGRKVYHMPDQIHYKKVVIKTSKGEKWFKTQREAIEAGFEKAKR